MKKLFLTSGVILCMACPALAATKDLVPQQNGGYLLSGTQDAPNCSTPDTLVSDINPTTFYAKWSAHEYQVMYHKQYEAQGNSPVTGTDEQVDDVYYGATYPIKTIGTAGFAKIGYDFAGWKSDHNLVSGATTDAPNMTPYGGTSAQSVTFGVNNAQTTHVYATWTPRTYNVIYDYNVHAKAGTTNLANYTDPNGMTFDSAYTALNYTASPINEHMAVADGYTFRGWSKSANSVYVEPTGNQSVADANEWYWTGETLSVLTDPAATEEQLTQYAQNGFRVYAIYTANGYKLTYDCGQYNSNRVGEFKDGYTTEAQHSTNVTFDGTIITLVDPSTMCQLGGYHVAAESWSCYKVNADGQYIDSTGAVTTTPANYVSVNYTAASGERVVGTWNVPSSVKCTITNWTPNTIGLTWEPGAGASANTTNAGAESCVYDGSIGVAGKPTKAGYDFQGWTTNPNAQGVFLEEEEEEQPTTPSQGE